MPDKYSNYWGDSLASEPWRRILLPEAELEGDGGETGEEGGGEEEASERQLLHQKLST